MRIKGLKDIKEIGDLRDLSTNDVIELLDELRAIAVKRGTELLGQGRHEARRAIGAPGGGTVTWAFVIGICVGAAAAAIATMLASPVSGSEARRRLAEQAERVRDRVAAAKAEGNGRSAYERERAMPTDEVVAPSGLTTPRA